MILLFLACDSFYAKPPPRPAPVPLSAGQKLSMVPPRWVRVEEVDGKASLVTRCGRPPVEYYVDKTAKGGPFFVIDEEGSQRRWRVGEIQGQFGDEVWTLPLEGPGLLRPELTLRWLDRGRGIGEWSGGPLETPIEVVSGDKDLLLPQVREPCPG